MAGADVCVLIPTLDEAATIGNVVDGFTEEGFEDILVVDGHSTDNTVTIARDHGAEVMLQSGSGKGHAVREGLDSIDAPYVLLVDGDGTYRPADARRMVAPLNGDVEHVIGNRFADLRPGAMSRLNQIGNRIINWLFRLMHGRDLKDILSGYRAFTMASVDRMRLTADGFGIETEMAVECVRNDLATEVVGISYLPRADDSMTNLRPVRDGGLIMTAIWRLAQTSNPMTYFGSLAMVIFLVAALIGCYVGYEWITRGILHQIMAMVTAFGILISVQLLTFGILSDMIVRLYE